MNFLILGGEKKQKTKNLKDKFYHCFVNFQNIFPKKPSVLSFHTDPSPDTTACICSFQGGWAVSLVSISMAGLQALSKVMGCGGRGGDGGGSKLFPIETNKFSGYSHENSNSDIKGCWIFVFQSKRCTDGALALLLFEPSWVFQLLWKWGQPDF